MKDLRLRDALPRMAGFRLLEGCVKIMYCMRTTTEGCCGHASEDPGTTDVMEAGRLYGRCEHGDRRR